MRYGWLRHRMGRSRQGGIVRIDQKAGRGPRLAQQRRAEGLAEIHERGQAACAGCSWC